MELLAPMLEKFGPTGLTIIMMGGGLVYLTRWLRDMQDSSQLQHAAIRQEFINTVKEKREDYRTSMMQERADFIQEMEQQRASHEKNLDAIVVRFEKALHEIAQDLNGLKIEVGKLTDKISGMR